MKLTVHYLTKCLSRLQELHIKKTGTEQGCLFIFSNDSISDYASLKTNISIKPYKLLSVKIPVESLHEISCDDFVCPCGAVVGSGRGGEAAGGPSEGPVVCRGEEELLVEAKPRLLDFAFLTHQQASLAVVCGYIKVLLLYLFI